MGTSEGCLVGLDGQTGFEQWNFKAGGGINSSPVVWEDAIYFGSDDCRLYAVLL